MGTTPPDQRIENSEIREWARSNGWPELSDRGKIPAEARSAHAAAQGPPPGPPPDQDDPGADDGADGEDDWAEIGDPPEDSAAAPPPPPAGDGQEGAPPPASLDEARDRVRDTRSAHLGRAGRRRASERLPGGPHGKARKPRAAADPPVKITPKVIGDVEGKMAFWLSLTAEPWMIADPYCGGAYADSVPGLASAIAPLICQSPDLVRMLTKSSQFILWTNLLMAARPVATAVIAHHVMKTVELEKDDQAEGGGQAPAPATDFARFSRTAGKPAAA